MESSSNIENFGRNVRFAPRSVYHPRSDAELLEILERHKDGAIRVGGAKHAWSDAITSDDAFVDMGSFDHVRVESDRVIVGAGCRISLLLQRLNQHGLTIPSVGLIDEQTVAGAVATGTHGSGKHSLSHYVQSLRVACFDETGERARMAVIEEGVDLQAARCSLGCMGVVTELTLPVIPQYYIREKATPCENLADALALEEESPLQQFFLFPHAFKFIVQERSVDQDSKRSRTAWLYRIYWFLTLDIGIHILVKLFACVLRSRRLIHFLFRSVIPSSLFPSWIVTDRSDRQLVMKHALFRHFEMELFVRRRVLPEAIEYLSDILRLADDPDHSLSSDTKERLRSAEMATSVDTLGGVFTHHYPICVRRIIPDDTLISMASADGDTEDWFSISLITFRSPRDAFCTMATFLADSMAALFAARVHWGKWFPQTSEHVSKLYPRLDGFKEVCLRYDPKGVFRNEFVNDRMGFTSDV